MQRIPLLCLHGWGGSKESFTELRTALCDLPVDVLAPDLPGFGAEPEPPRPWSVDDYADWVIEWLQCQHPSACSRPLFLLGHSHGGRIALKLARRTALQTCPIPLRHLFLCAPAGIRHPRHLRRLLGLVLAKGGQPMTRIPGLKNIALLAKKLLYKFLRVHDYEQASPMMRATMQRVTAENLRPILKNIRLPTDLFWGTADRMTPYSDAKIMAQLIPDAVLHTFPGIGHRVHRDRATEIAAVIRVRIGL